MPAEGGDPSSICMYLIWTHEHVHVRLQRDMRCAIQLPRKQGGRSALTDKKAGTCFSHLGQHTCIFKAPHRRFTKAMVKIAENGCHAVQPCIDQYVLELDLEGTVPD